MDTLGTRNMDVYTFRNTKYGFVKNEEPPTKPGLRLLQMIVMIIIMIIMIIMMIVIIIIIII